MNELQTVTFYDDTIFVVDHDNEPYVPMRTLIESMGLAWVSQYSKLNHNRKRWGVMKIITPSKSGQQTTICIPLRKLPGFLATINANKVKNTLRSKIITYQNECDDALWDYWNQGKKLQPTLDLAELEKRIRQAIKEEVRLALPKPKKGRPRKQLPAPPKLKSRERLLEMVAKLTEAQLWDAEHVMFLLNSGHNITWKGSDIGFNRQ